MWWSGPEMCDDYKSLLVIAKFGYGEILIRNGRRKKNRNKKWNNKEKEGKKRKGFDSCVVPSSSLTMTYKDSVVSRRSLPRRIKVLTSGDNNVLHPSERARRTGVVGETAHDGNPTELLAVLRSGK